MNPAVRLQMSASSGVRVHAIRLHTNQTAIVTLSILRFHGHNFCTITRGWIESLKKHPLRQIKCFVRSRLKFVRPVIRQLTDV